MSPAAKKASTLGFYKERILCALVHIQGNLDERIDLHELAGVAGLSPFHFHRVFRGMLGESVMAHVRRLRLERAAGWLHASARPVVDIAFEAGYDSHEAFGRAFKEAFGRTPTAYRTLRREGEHLHAPSGVHYRGGALPRDFRALSFKPGTMDIEIVTLPPVRVAYVRHVGPYNECSEAWDKLSLWLGKEGYLGAGCRFIGISYDDPEATPAEKIRYDACAEVGPDFQPDPASGVGAQMIAGGDYARVTHKGPYENLSRSYGKIMGQWLPRQGRRMRNAPCFEVYLNNPENTEPADLVTDIHVPLETP